MLDVKHLRNELIGLLIVRVSWRVEAMVGIVVSPRSHASALR